ncbi:hypothetical protein GGR58DRAFT_513793 [Xylaria digitata]|nr:hypothetical protein GGR58DRAFT_513793 [Xylaria digitata]
MAWPKLSPRRATKDATSRKSRGLSSPALQDPPPRHQQAVETLHVPPQAHFHGPILTRPEVDSKQKHPISNLPSSRETISGDGLRRDITGNPGDAQVSSLCTNTSQDNWKGKGVEKGPDQQGRGSREIDADGEERSRSIWERTAAKTSGQDGGCSSAFRDRPPLPWWLRDP